MFSSHNTFNPNTDMPSLRGKTVLVTGGNNGLGLQSVRHFAAAGAKVYMCSRSVSKAEQAIQSLSKPSSAADPDTEPPSSPSFSNIHILQLDLSSLEAIKTAARQFLSENDRLDILMLNAGIMAQPPCLTADGYEAQFGTNYLGHAALARLLLPVLTRTAEQQPGSDVRVVTLTSVAQQWLAPAAGMLLDRVGSDMDDLGPWGRYGHSKLANVYFAKGLAARSPGRILSVAVHPGGVRGTKLHDAAMNTTGNWVQRTLMAVGERFMAPVEEGVRGQLWASVADRGEVGTGRVYYPVGREHKGRELMNDKEQIDRLWEWTEKELVRRGF
ncbi:hypothetical protein BKA67DRAFT_523352 [Truncatella angustata]|uniref:Uncharacterized protein n=1 Tax=Truncatella angustata TaxID=152316 RepID=A0A9P8RKF1_9PEZI|nr:uncharacterized protein BKA67DRAFT_523352 [Truncatella angustata]KAH6647461.1 hypothetical protein BKA67DRAFT_523352 [Truncatella angustata]